MNTTQEHPHMTTTDTTPRIHHTRRAAARIATCYPTDKRGRVGIVRCDERRSGTPRR